MKIYVSPEPPFGVAPPKTDRPPPTQQEAAETSALIEAFAAVHDSKRLTGRHLSRLARHLRQNPQLRVHPVMAPYLDVILDRVMADYAPSDPGSVAKGVNVEFWQKNGLTLIEARRRVAAFFGISISRLKQACWEFQRKYRR